MGDATGLADPSPRHHLTLTGWTLERGTLRITWSGVGRTFTEEFSFPTPPERTTWLDRVIDLLAVVASVSYAKAFAPCIVDAPDVSLTPAGLALVESAFGPGMAEFGFVNGIADPVVLGAHGLIAGTAPAAVPLAGPPVVPVGGGRDSCVVVRALEGMAPRLLSVGGGTPARRVAAALDRGLDVVGRRIDSQVLEMNAVGAPNGHVPITAITMLVSVIHAASVGAGAVVMANEASASNPTRVGPDGLINHQHSKSLAFELALHEALVSVGAPVRCFSVLRDRGDADISRVFVAKCADLHGAFVSCNRAGVTDATRRSESWCGDCAKCRSLFLSLAAHANPSTLAGVFGVDLLADARQTEGFADLLEADRKPFECVQTVEEARATIGVLASSPTWRDHAVVAKLADRAAPAPAPPAAGLGPHVPAEYRRAMEEFFS